MDLLKKVFPFSFVNKNDVAALVINVIIHVVVGAVAGVVIGLLKDIPVVNLLTGLLGTLVEVYITAGVVLTFLHYFKVVK